ncbi:MAG TPA: hypothetical protein VFH89_14130 [Sphingomicrobium sp.]|nr:hypothetical protein [Sphingomicrobium sp.]
MRLWDAVRAAASGVEDDGSYDSPTGPDDCRARRAAAFRMTATELGLSEDWGSKPYGVVMDMRSQRGVTTILAFANGDASLLHDKGSGIIGRSSHVHVVVQAKRLVARAAEHASSLSPTTSFPLPRAGSVRFYVLTADGILTSEAPTQDVRSGASSLSPLIEVADELLSEFIQYRLPDQIKTGPLKAADWVKAFAMIGTVCGLTYAAWLIPTPWLRWPAVAIGVFLTISALIVPYAMWVVPDANPKRPDPTARS